MRLDYVKINSRAVNLLLSIEEHVPSIDDRLKALVGIRVSQINGCAYCVDFYSNEAGSVGELQQRLNCLWVWRESQLFSAKEMAALDWAESVTNISTELCMENKLNQLLEQFSETEVVDLTLIISLVNNLNRLSISLGDKPPIRKA